MCEIITHLSKAVSIQLVGEKIRFPTEIHKTYCGLEVNPSEIDNNNPICDDCQDWLTWNEIDSLAEEK
jgi:hypothetical protein